MKKRGIQVRYRQVDNTCPEYNLDFTFRHNCPDVSTKCWAFSILVPLIRLSGHSLKNIGKVLREELPELFEEGEG